jgi:hypothetical protein
MYISLHAFILPLFFLLSTPAFAVYKCEANGKITYSDMPCNGEKMFDISHSTTDNSANAKQQLAQEKKLLTQLEKERHKREAQEAREQQRAAKVYASKQKNCAQLARRKKWADEDVASATGKSAEKVKRKARRLSEQYDAECPLVLH